MAEPWLDDADQRTWRAYLGSHARLVAELNRRLMEVAGLTIADYEVLVHLSEGPRGRLRPKGLADAMQWERSRLTHHLGRMERRALVAREPCEEDGRGSLVAITTAGRRALRRAAPHHAADVKELFVVPTGPDLATVEAVSGRIGNAIDTTQGPIAE